MKDYLLTLAYLLPLGIIWYIVAFRRKSHAQLSEQIYEKNLKAGLTEPASLHPMIDRSLCIGCASCVDACPEGNILGVIGDKAELINPTKCIGHGACKAACPVDAINLVFGTATRGVDIPMVDENFETNIPGIFIAGELGGMGLIRNAIEQGRQAIEYIAKKNRGSGGGIDVVIVGAGPSGFSASLGAMEKKLRAVTIEQESLGGTVAHYPRGKVVMTSPANLPMVGKVRIGKTTKEYLLSFWTEVAEKTSVKINYEERMETIQPTDNGFVVKSNRATYITRNVLLCIGRRGTPRKLGVPGEQLPKVVYRLIDPEQYRNQHVLVVGGGNSALEAATSIADEQGTTVTLSYRSAAFSRAAEENRDKVEEMRKQGRLQVVLHSNVKNVTENTVLLDQNGEQMDIPNDAIIVSAGGLLPTPFLKKMGIIVETKHGTS